MTIPIRRDNYSLSQLRRIYIFRIRRISYYALLRIHRISYYAVFCICRIYILFTVYLQYAIH